MVVKTVIRKGRLKDAEVVVKLWQELMEYHHQIAAIDFMMIPNASELWLKFYRTHVRSRTKISLVAEEDGKIVGYLLGSIQPRPPIFKVNKEAMITDMYVASNKRRKGIGNKLVLEFFNWAKIKEMKYAVLNVVPENEPGKKFWSNHGFTTIMQFRSKTI
jgi:ribosomal protein S18 acetylase RimI-like enzyme